MKISKSAAVVVSSALLTILVLVAVRTQDPVSGALPTGPTTPTPTVTTESGGPSTDSTTPPPAKASTSSAPSTESTTPPLPKLKATAVASGVLGIRPRLENAGFSGSGDISDDAAIWVDPADPRRSVVIADNKADDGGGIGVFGMNGKLIQFRPDGRIGNVDLRTGFPGRKGSVVLVGANNRSTNTLSLWSLDTKTRRLSSRACSKHQDHGIQLRILPVSQPGQRQVLRLRHSGGRRVHSAVRAAPPSFRLDRWEAGQKAPDQRYGRGLRRG